MTRRSFRISITCISLASLLLRWLVPPNPVYGSVHDDELMVTMARGILDTGWIGDYSNVGHLLTSKPPGFSIFLAYTHFLPWAPTVTIHFGLLLGFLLFVRELRAFGISRRFVIFSYSLLAFFPVWFNEPMSRIYREGLLTALTSLTLGSTFWLTRSMAEVCQEQMNLLKILKRVSVPATVFGLTAGFFIITKPSWHFFFVLMLSLFVSTIFFNKESQGFRKKLQIIGVLVTLIVVTCFVPISFVLTKNHHHFGFYGLDNFSQGDFSKAMKVLYSIKDNSDRPYIDVTKEMRADAYKISPTMELLHPYLELPDGQGWRYQPCVTPLKVCDESGAWFPWDLRDAVEKAGLGDSPKEFNLTFSKIADEIERACSSKKIECESPGLAVGLDSLDSLSPRIVVDSVALGIQALIDPSLGLQQRGEAIELDSKTIELWDSTIKGLPPRQFTTYYRSGTTFLADTRILLGKVYESFWALLLLIGIAGVITRIGKISKVSNRAQCLGFGLIGSVLVSILQISLLEASNGFFMTSGANLYLVPMFPFLCGVVIIGLARWCISVVDSIEHRSGK